MEMYLKYCKKCLMPNTRPNIKFNDDGTCSACINFEKQKTTDWDKRWMELEKICDRYRGNTENDYDCAIAVSGGKDSHFQTYIIKENKFIQFVSDEENVIMSEYVIKKSDFE